MDHSKLIDEIVSRVAAKLAEASGETFPGEVCGGCGDADRPALLVLTQQHGTDCHALLDSQTLRGHYRTDCALLSEGNIDIADYEVVVLYQLTNEALGKLACGVCDTPYTKLASQAVLMGKRVYVPTEEVELYRYASTAPAAYYAMMREKLDLLANSGVVICAQSSLERAIVSGSAGSAPACPVLEARTERPDKELRLTKRLLSERDVASASAEHFTCIRLPAKCIITALAQECARERGICLVRD